MRQSRRCSRSGCAQPAAATLTYVYAESTAVVGPLATFSEPHSYDLCEFHAERLTVPRGWEVVRHEIDLEDSGPTGDDLLALADAVREAARPEPPRDPADDGSGTRRGHLRVLPDLPETVALAPSPHSAHAARVAAVPSAGTGCVADLSSIIKAYDVRGVVPDEWDEDVARAIGAAFAEFVVARERRDRRGHRARHARLLDPAVARLRRGRDQPRPRRHRGRARLDRPAVLRRRLAGPARRDVHRQPQPRAVQRHQDVPGRGRPDRAGLRAGHHPRVGRAGQLRPRARPGRRRSSTRDVLARVRRLPALAGRPLADPPAEGRRRRRQRHGRAHRAGRPRRPAAGRSSRCTSSSTARSPTTRPTRSTRPTWSTCRRRSASTAPTSGWPSTATPTGSSSSTSGASRSAPRRSPRWSPSASWPRAAGRRSSTT